MPSRAEIVQSIYGAWRIALRDPDGIRYFNITADGFWRSFFAAAIVAPFYLILLLLTFDLAGAADPTGYAIAEALAFVICWAGFVVLMAPITQLLKLAPGYAAYIIVWNWAAVLQVAVILPAALLRATGLLSGGVGDMLLFAAYLTSLYIAFLAARVGLRCDILVAIGLVVFENLLRIGVEGLAIKLFG